MEVETIKSNVGMSVKFQPLGEIVSISKGKKHIAVDYGKNRYINIENIHNSANSLFTNESGVHVEENDLIIAWDGANAGKVGVGYKGVIGSTLARLKIKTLDVSSSYLFWYLESKNDLIKSQRTGATIPHINGGALRELQIPLPPLTTQKRIAEILDAADALRRKDQELLKKYDELAQAIFIDMFGDPVKNEKGWDVKSLKDISTKIHSGNTPKGGSNVYVDKGITFFRSQNVWKNNLIYEDIAFIDHKTHKSMYKSSLKHKDILMTKTGRINTENSSLGRAAIYFGEDDKANVNGHVYLIRLERNQIHEFVVYIMTSKEYRDLIREVCVGGIDKRQLNKDHIENFPIIYPPIESQKNFQKELQNIWHQKTICESSLINTESIFNSLIQKAFKGELV